MGKVFSDQKGPKPLPLSYIREYRLLILTPFMIVRLYTVRSAQSAFYNIRQSVRRRRQLHQCLVMDESENIERNEIS